jgi:hypothetical protein
VIGHKRARLVIPDGYVVRPGCCIYCHEESTPKVLRHTNECPILSGIASGTIDPLTLFIKEGSKEC